MPLAYENKIAAVPGITVLVAPRMGISIGGYWRDPKNPASE